MIIQAAPLASEPRISANELAKFVCENLAGRKKIATDQKYPPVFKTVYYQKAESGILGALENGKFSEAALDAALLKLEKLEPKNPNQNSVKIRNLHVLNTFKKVQEEATPYTGDHRKRPKKAFLLKEGVLISVRPDIITTNEKEGYIALTKLHYSKSPYSEDSAEILLYLLLEFGKTLSTPGLEFSLEKSRLVDCQNGNVITADQISPNRERQVALALAEFARMWPNLQPHQKRSRGTKPNVPKE